MSTEFTWEVDAGANANYERIGAVLGQLTRDSLACRWPPADSRFLLLFRNGTCGQGLLDVRANGQTRLLTKAADLAPLLGDHLGLGVVREGKLQADMPSAAHMNALLRSEAFLRHFEPVDRVVRTPVYLEDFSLTRPWLNRAGDGERILYLGPEPWV